MSSRTPSTSTELFDLTPKGRDEDDLPAPVAWVRRHDEYESKGMCPKSVPVSLESIRAESRELGFRCTEFSETQSMLLLILENPICRGILYVADRGYARIDAQLSGVESSRKLSF